jgi:hypothetical protein
MIQLGPVSDSYSYRVYLLYWRGKSEHSHDVRSGSRVAGNTRVWQHIGASRDADAERLGF